MRPVRYNVAPRTRYARLLSPALPASPMQMSMDMLRKLGYDAVIVEHRPKIPGLDLPITRDLFGFADIVAMKEHFLFVQTTSAPNVMARVHKIQASARFESVKRAGGLVHVHGWGPGGVKVIDMTARDEDGQFVYATLWDSIVRSGPRSKKKPRVQLGLGL